MRSILAVDDSPSMRKMVSFTLTGAGFKVVEAVDGVDALEKAQMQEIDLVLADPPYAEARAGGWLVQLADLLVRNRWVKPGGVFVFETEGWDPLPPLPGWRLARDKTYGSTRVLIWVREDENSPKNAENRPETG